MKKIRIAYIAAGAAGMYCGSCIHDNTLAAALIKRGHDVALIPTYTPMRTDEQSVSLDRIFLGGLNVYLSEKSGLFRRTAWLFERFLNHPTLLNWISKFSATTDARDLGRLTVSVLKGEEGHQRREVLKLVRWLKETYKPDIVQLTNSMFLGLAHEIKRELGVPVICALQGEDLFLDDLIEPYKSQALQLLRARARDVDGFIATSEYYADFMTEYLDTQREKMHVVRLGINLAGHGLVEKRSADEPFVIGYLARICPEKGLHLLAEAFYHLHQKLGAGKVRLKIAGYLSKKDHVYFKNIQKQLAEWGVTEHVDYLGEVDRLEKISFLNSVDVLSVPTVYRESKGLFVLEALANGVPVVQPRHGSFPEMIESTGGGILVEPESSEDLADGILQLLEDLALREQLGRKGKDAVFNAFSDEKMAEATVQVYAKFLARDEDNQSTKNEVSFEK